MFGFKLIEERGESYSLDLLDGILSAKFLVKLLRNVIGER